MESNNTNGQRQKTKAPRSILDRPAGYRYAGFARITIDIEHQHVSVKQIVTGPIKHVAKHVCEMLANECKS